MATGHANFIFIIAQSDILQNSGQVEKSLAAPICDCTKTVKWDKNTNGFSNKEATQENTAAIGDVNISMNVINKVCV